MGRNNQILDPELARVPAVRLSRLRTCETLEVGRLRRRVGLNTSMACRWCAPEEHARAPPINQSLQQQYNSRDPVTCPYCDPRRTYARARNYLKHHRSRHKNCQLPEPLRSAVLARNQCNRLFRPEGILPDRENGPSGPRPCPYCGEVKPYRHPVRCRRNPNQRGTVFSRRGLPAPPRVLPEELRPPRDGVAQESVTHVLLECPVLANLRQRYPELGSSQRCWASLKENRQSILHFLDEAISMLLPYLKVGSSSTA